MKLFVSYHHKSYHRFDGCIHSKFGSVVIDTQKYPILDENLEFELDEYIAEEKWLETMTNIVKDIHMKSGKWIDAEVSILYYREAVYGTTCKKTL